MYKGWIKSTGNTAVAWWWVWELPALWTWTRNVRWVSAARYCAECPKTVFTKLEQHSWIKIEVAWCCSTQCFQGLLKACGDAALPYHKVARWIKMFEKAGIAIQDNSMWRKHNSTPCFPGGCRLPMVCTWVNSGSLNVSQKCAPHSQTFCITANLQCIRIPHEISKVQQWYCCTVAQALLAKGRQLRSWKNCHHGCNLGSLIWTKLETLIKWIEASRFSSSKESASYTMCCEVDVHCGVWHWWSNTALRCTSKGRL